MIWFIIFFWRIQIRIYSGWQKKANMNTNIFGLNKKGKYKYEYIWVEKKVEYIYEHEYSDWSLLIWLQKQIFVTHWFNGDKYW